MAEYKDEQMVYLLIGDTIQPLTMEEWCDLICGTPEEDWKEEDEDDGQCWDDEGNHPCGDI